MEKICPGPSTRNDDYAGAPLPTYDELLAQVEAPGVDTRQEWARLDDGRLALNVHCGLRRVPASLRSQLLSQESQLAMRELPPPPPRKSIPALNIVMQVVGSQGDVQPFIVLAKELQKHGHRVRIATHPAFRRLVQGYDLEFFSIGGNPAELMAYMVRNPGLLPRMSSVHSGEVYQNRRVIRDMMRACWRSCFESSSGSERDEGPDEDKERGDPKPFVADAIIANPPSFAHIHCAERLGIPLHLVFTMPWSPTAAFPHPLVELRGASEREAKMSNLLSFYLIDVMLWQGLGDLVNRFRDKVLGLEPIDPTQAPGLMQRFHVPHSYCWSPSLVPKPGDWPSNTAVSGFLFLPTPAGYQPPVALLEFLAAGPPPVYIGFGSIVVEDPSRMTGLILQAIRLAGVRAVVSAGWGGLGHSSVLDNDPSILLISSCPDAYLFPLVSAVVHHGGAGTTAAGLRAGKPSVIVPFFGDQAFWGNRVHRYGAGPEPLPAKSLSAENLAAALVAVTSYPTMSCRAREVALMISQEDGAKRAVDHFHACLPQPVHRDCCDLRADEHNQTIAAAAVWRYTKSNKNAHRRRRRRRLRADSPDRLPKDLKLSALAATVLRKAGLLNLDELELHRPCEYDVKHLGPFEPVSGAMWAVGELMYETFKGMGEILFEFVRVPMVVTIQQKILHQAYRSRKAEEARSSDMGGGQKEVDHRDQDEDDDDEDDALEGFVAGRKMKQPPADEGVNRRCLPLAKIAALDANDGGVTRHFGVPGKHAGRGVLRIGKAAARAPGAFTLAMARGAHNVPLLWGDRTVRTQGKVTGVASGVKEGVKELTFGVSDGVSGLFMQPIWGVMEDGALGFVKGMGKGVLGLPVKFYAAASGIVGYPLKGIDVGITNALRGDRGVQAIRQARIVQGEAEWFACSAGEKSMVMKRWEVFSARQVAED
ncbi:hypothetical protein MMC13_000767 [Lambiella insularis]|nr:hypothetical protein [Lambiella insularis]